MAKHEAFGRHFSTDPEDWTCRSSSARSVKMEVLVLGLPRTGTACKSKPGLLILL